GWPVSAFAAMMHAGGSFCSAATPAFVMALLQGRRDAGRRGPTGLAIRDRGMAVIHPSTIQAGFFGGFPNPRPFFFRAAKLTGAVAPPIAVGRPADRGGNDCD